MFALPVIVYTIKHISLWAILYDLWRHVVASHDCVL